ncbi:hypothetical protein [Priestia megaterium]|uniref:hypothetical protein n=2 Tax=Priestia megaterium TaxID=1404 RepID=UPI0039F67C58
MFKFNNNEDFINMLSLGVDLDLDTVNSQKVDFRKSLGKIQAKSRKDAKGEECFYCGEKCSSFCNSHSIPAFFLRNIAVDGDVYNNNKLVSFPLLDEDKGVNNTGTFQLICRDCDSKIFSDYENPDNYQNTPTSKMIAQIAMKNSLKSIAKRKFEIALYTNMKNDMAFPNDFYEQRQLINHLDLKEYIEDFNKAKRIEKKGWDNEYYLFYHQKLDYVVPIAFQSNIALVIDFKGSIINDIYNKSSNYKIQSMHICVFPLETSSIIMMFVDSKHKRYRSFYKQFKKLTPQDKLAAINYIIFSYSEDVYINKEVNEEVLQDTGLIDASRKGFDVLSTQPTVDAEMIGRENLDFSEINSIPNLLSEEFKIQQL